MNENIDLTKILKDCPKGTNLWHTVYGEVEFNKISNNKPYLVFFTRRESDCIDSVTTDGRMFEKYDGECVLLPSKEQRDWSKFVPTWETKKEVVKVTLHPFDKVLVRRHELETWDADFFIKWHNTGIVTFKGVYKYCIPYNKDTAHLLDTIDMPDVEYKFKFSKEYKE